MAGGVVARGWRGLAVAAVVVFALVGCGGATSENDFLPGQSVPSGFPSETDYESALFAATNAARAALDLPPVEASTCAADIAHERVLKILPTGALEHPDGSLVCPGFSAAGENLVHGTYLPAQAVDAWLASPGHRANIVNPHFTHMGISCIATSLSDPTEHASSDVGGMLCSQVFEGTYSE